MSEQETPADAPAPEQDAPASAPPEQAPSQETISKADVETLLAGVEERLAKRLKQSAGDRIRQTVTSEVKDALAGFDEAAKALAPLLREDATPEQIEALKERRFLRSLMETPSPDPEPEPQTPPQAAAPEQPSSPTGLEAEIQQILQGHNLSGSEPELRQYLQERKGRPWYEVGAGFAELAGQVAARAGGTAAGVAAPPGQAPKRDLAAEFRSEVGELLKLPHRNPRLLRTLEAKYRALGLSDEDMQVGPTGSVKPGSQPGRDYLYASEGMQ